MKKLSGQLPDNVTEASDADDIHRTRRRKNQWHGVVLGILVTESLQRLMEGKYE
jgi:hypothetical protein